MRGGHGLPGFESTPHPQDIPTPTLRPDAQSIREYDPQVYNGPNASIDQPGSAPMRAQTISGVKASRQDMAAIENFSREWGINRAALVGKLNIESGIDPSATNGNYHGIFQLSTNQVPELTEKAGLGRLTPDQFRQTSVSDQLLVMGQYYRKAGIEPSGQFFTNDPQQDSARLWTLQLSPSNALKIDYSDPNVVISATNQADRIEARQGLVTVGSAMANTPREGLNVIAGISDPQLRDQSFAQNEYDGRDLTEEAAVSAGNINFSRREQTNVDPELLGSVARAHGEVGVNDVNITSGYRSKAYNDMLYRSRGKRPTNSYHSGRGGPGLAVDFGTAHMTPEQQRGILSRLAWGGKSVGTYDRSNPHIDVRPNQLFMHNATGRNYQNSNAPGYLKEAQANGGFPRMEYVTDRIATPNLWNAPERGPDVRQQPQPTQAAGNAGDNTPMGRGAFQGRTADQMTGDQRNLFSAIPSEPEPVNVAQQSHPWADLADDSVAPSFKSSYRPDAQDPRGTQTQAPQYKTITSYETRYRDVPYNEGKGGTYGYDDGDWWDDELMSEWGPTSSAPSKPQTRRESYQVPVTKRVRVQPAKQSIKQPSALDRILTRNGNYSPPMKFTSL